MAESPPACAVAVAAVRVAIYVHSNQKVWRPVLLECLGAMFVIVAFNTLRKIAVLMINPCVTVC